MDWMEVHIQTSHDGLETVEAFLSGLGIDGVVIDDETEFREFLEENRKCWDYVDEELLKKEAGPAASPSIWKKLRTAFPGWRKCAWRWRISRPPTRSAPPS